MISNHFNAAAQNWDTEETIKRNACFAESIIKHLPCEGFAKRVMDFGCGTGLMSSHFISDAEVLVGIDTSSGMLEKFNHRLQNNPCAKSLCLNLEDDVLPLGLPLFDIIISGMAFHHLIDPLKVLGKLKSSLAPNGFIFIIDLDKEDGTFHPDNIGMGVRHFGFSRDNFESWSKDLHFKSFQHQIIHQIKKNNREYGIALGIFQNN